MQPLSPAFTTVRILPHAAEEVKLMRKIAFSLVLAAVGAALLVVFATGTASADVWPPHL
jgi:hypothetical protein